MKAVSYFGYKCPRCGSTIDIGATVGSSDEPACPHCGTIMKPDPHGKTSAANVYCPKCNASFGLVNSDRCPKCGGPFSRIK
jgi:DNA-directed RNA polymerase subunit RPC12/RpoP